MTLREAIGALIKQMNVIASSDQMEDSMRLAAAELSIKAMELRGRFSLAQLDEEI